MLVQPGRADRAAGARRLRAHRHLRQRDSAARQHCRWRSTTTAWKPGSPRRCRPSRKARLHHPGPAHRGPGPHRGVAAPGRGTGRGDHLVRAGAGLPDPCAGQHPLRRHLYPRIPRPLLCQGRYRPGAGAGTGAGVQPQGRHAGPLCPAAWPGSQQPSQRPHLVDPLHPRLRPRQPGRAGLDHESRCPWCAATWKADAWSTSRHAPGKTCRCTGSTGKARSRPWPC